MFKQYHKTRQNSATLLGDLIPKIMNLTINAKSTTKRSPALSTPNWFPVQVKIVSQSYYMDANKLDDSKTLLQKQSPCGATNCWIMQLLLWVIFLDNLFCTREQARQVHAYQAECVSSRICGHSLTLKFGNTILNARDCLQGLRCKMWPLRHRQAGPMLEQ